MSKLRSDKISFNNDDFVVAVEIKKEFTPEPQPPQEIDEPEIEEINEKQLILNQAKSQSNEILLEAQSKADSIILEAKAKAQSLENEALENAKLEAQKILDEANTQAQEIIETKREEHNTLVESARSEIEKTRIEEAKKGYEDGYKDAQEKLLEELEEKINAVDNFCLKQYEIRNKVLKAAGKDIFDIITNISKKILTEEPDKKTLEKIIKNTISLLEKKENVNIILSQKYAQILFEIQKKEINNDELEFKFEDFKQFEGFNVIFNPEFDDDTIIIENPLERFDASINTQLDVIISDAKKNTKNGYLEVDDYLKEDEPKRIK